MLYVRFRMSKTEASELCLLMSYYVVSFDVGGLGGSHTTTAGPVYMYYWPAKSWRGIPHLRAVFHYAFLDSYSPMKCLIECVGAEVTLNVPCVLRCPGAGWTGWRILLKTHRSRWLWRIVRPVRSKTLACLLLLLCFSCDFPVELVIRFLPRMQSYDWHMQGYCRYSTSIKQA